MVLDFNSHEQFCTQASISDQADNLNQTDFMLKP